MPEPTETQTVETTTEVTPVKTEREQLYAKMGYTTEEAPKPDPVTTEPAGPSVEDTVKAANAPLLAEIEALKQSLAGLTKPKVEEPTKAEPDWVECLKNNDIDGFKKGFEKAVRDTITPQIVEQSKRESVEEMETRSELNSFNTSIRSNNKDLAEVEDWIASVALGKFNAAGNAGKVTDYKTYISEYKAAVNEAVADIRNRIQRYRADGKTEAMTVRKEVMSSTPLSPNTVTSTREQSKVPTEPDTSPANYLQRRAEQSRRQRGLST